jgi:hypothetical protein
MSVGLNPISDAEEPNHVKISRLRNGLVAAEVLFV